MRRGAYVLLLLVGAIIVPAWSGGASKPNRDAGPGNGSICGVLLIQWGPEVRPGVGIPVYLFDAEQSRRLTWLQEEASRHLNQPGLAKHEKHRIGQRYFDGVSVLIHRLAAVAVGKTKTDKEGLYRFLGVPPGKTYKVVAFEEYEDHAIVAIRTTPVLKPGQELRVDLEDLDESEPWWESR